MNWLQEYEPALMVIFMMMCFMKECAFLNVQVEIKHTANKSSVIANGEEAVFAEFGAGVYYNGPVGSFPHPNKPIGVVAIGKYGHGYGSREIWVFYDKNREPKFTHGTPASMPMYHAMQELIQIAPQIAKEALK